MTESVINRASNPCVKSTHAPLSANCCNNAILSLHANILASNNLMYRCPFQNSDKLATFWDFVHSFWDIMQNPQLFGQPRVKNPYAVFFVKSGYNE